MTSPSFELDFQSPDSLPTAQQADLINRVGNHEGKLLITSVMANYPGTAFRQVDLYNELVERQGDQLKWRPAKPLGSDYCAKSLVPIGAVHKETVSGHRGPTAAYSISEFGSKWGLPLAGSLLDWSLQYPDISLMQVFGSTSSNYAVRSPEVRLRIYQELLGTTVERPSYRHIANAVTNDEIQSNVVEKQLRSMASLGLLAINSTLEAYDPDIDIVNPGFQHLTMGFDSLLPRTQAVYRTLQMLTSEGKTTVGLNYLIEKIMTDHEDLNLDYHTLRQNILNGISETSTNYPGIQVHNRAMPENQRTAVTLSSSFSGPITDVVSRIKAVFSNENRAENVQRATDIISSPQTFGTLMAKVMNFSPAVAGKSDNVEKLNRHLLGIIERLGKASLKSIKTELESQGRQMTVEGIRCALEPLIEADAVAIEKTPLPQKRKLVNYYSVPKAT